MEIPFNATSLDRLKLIKGFRWDYQLAEYLKVDHTTISEWRAGRSKPNYRALVLMMSSGVSLEEIAGDISKTAVLQAA